jgi:hypothetical protein
MERVADAQRWLLRWPLRPTAYGFAQYVGKRCVRVLANPFDGGAAVRLQVRVETNAGMVREWYLVRYDAGTFTLQKERTTTAYTCTVTPTRLACSCPDFVFRRARLAADQPERLCKHLRALEVTQLVAMARAEGHA